MRRLLLLPFLLAACSSDDPTPAGGADAAPPAAEATYYAAVKPIIDARCVNCHVEGGIGPMPLTTYDEVAQFAAMIAEETTARRMPPWKADDGCTDYFGDFSLDDAQIATIATWAAAGAPAGDATKPGAPLADDMPSLSRVDLTLAMPEPYTNMVEPDDYRCFLVPWPETTTQFVTGFSVTPGNAAIVHHVIAFLATPEQVQTYQDMDAAESGPGYTCFGGTGGPARTWVGGWAPGSRGSDMPPGLGIQVEPGSMIILQVHYNSLAGGFQQDQSSIQLKLDPTVEKPATVQPWTNPSWVTTQSMLIPAGDGEVMHAWDFDAAVLADGSPMTLYAAALHMHQLGTRARLSVEHADGTSECLLSISDYDFHWQGIYGFTQPKSYQPGDQLHLECHYDNSAENQPYVNDVQQAPRDVTWGEGTTDEMCLGIFLWTR